MESVLFAPARTLPSVETMRFRVGCAAVAAITLVACGFAMDDLSSQPATKSDRAGGLPTTGPAPQSDATPSGGGDYQLPSADDAGTPLQSGCQIVTLAPTQGHDEGEGTPWIDPGSATNDDGMTAQVPLSPDNRNSRTLVVDHLAGAAIPAIATIKGVLVDVDRSSGDCIVGRQIALRVGASERTRAIDGNWDKIALFGGLDDLWSEAPITPADLASPTAGVTIGIRFQGQCRPREGRVDAVRVRVHYCL